MMQATIKTFVALGLVAGLALASAPWIAREQIDAAQPSVVGDVDCDGVVNAVDALKLLRHNAGLPVAQTDPCQEIGSSIGTTTYFKSQDFSHDCPDAFCTSTLLCNQGDLVASGGFKAIPEGVNADVIASHALNDLSGWEVRWSGQQMQVSIVCFDTA
jgi:hypothetical protein